MSNQATYTSKLGVGLGLVEETHALLALWHPGMSTMELYSQALQNGAFPGISARRLRNIVQEGFAGRYLVAGGRPVRTLKALSPILTPEETTQLLFLYTCRANAILADFVRQVYWLSYAAGAEALTMHQSRTFVEEAQAQGKMARPWSESTVCRVSSHLLGACADFGLLERGRKQDRRILPFHLQPRVGILLAYDLHLNDLADGQVVTHPDWALFGLSAEGVRTELKQLANLGGFIVQAAGDLVRLSWAYANWEELVDAILQRRF